ncbi:MAG: stealth family protein [Actinomycetes bacterium]
MFRQSVQITPRRFRARLVGLLPAWLYRWLRATDAGASYAQRVMVWLSARRLRGRQAALLAREGVRIQGVGLRAWLCDSVAVMSAEEVRRANLDLVVDVLDRHGIDYFWVSTGSHERHCIGVAAGERQAVLLLLARELGRRPAYVSSPVGGRGRLRHVLAHELRPARLGDVPYVRVTRLVSSPCGRLVLGFPYGCEIEFWTQDQAGTLQAPRPNRVASTLPRAHRRPATLSVRHHTYRTLEPFAHHTIHDVGFPVDAVYTWVDGSDPAWLAKKDRHLRLAGRAPMNVAAANSARYVSRDELKYSLRSLELNADWIRTVFVVTDDQVPPWLDTSNPRVRVVSHREIFGEMDCLPTFNSHAIESRLHHIQGLAQHYLYLNDDFFFGRPVPPELFFQGNGVAKFFLSTAQLDLGPAELDDPPVMSAAKNNRRLVEDGFGVTVTHKLKHVPHSQRRDVLFEMEERFRGHFLRTAASRFRNHQDLSIPSALHAYYAYCTGRAVPGELRYMYTDLCDPLTPSRLQRLLRDRHLDVFCLNDTDHSGVDAEEQARSLERFLAAYYPMASSFERPLEAVDVTPWQRDHRTRRSRQKADDRAGARQVAQ